MTKKTAKVSIICIITIFIFSCCGIVMAHRANERFRKSDFHKNRQQNTSQMFNKGRDFGGPMFGQFARPNGQKPDFRGPGMGRGPGFMGDRQNLSREEICKTCPICNGKGMGRPEFFRGEKEGPKGPDFKKPEPLKQEENKVEESQK